MAEHDVIVLGLGAMGSACAYQLAKRGAKVLGLDLFDPPHEQGSSHGETRITRLAIGEGEQYTPLAQRSHELWREIERETGADLLTVTGGLIVSSDAPRAATHVEGFFANTVAAARKFGIAHELLDASEIRRRFPQFNVRDNEIGYFEPDAGFLRPEACVRAQLSLAGKYGAEIHTNEKAVAIENVSGAVTVKTDRRSYSADRLILAAGSWLPSFLGARYEPVFRVYRQVQFWFDVAGPGALYQPGRMPVFIWEVQGGAQGIYGFPAVDGARGGVKVATEQYLAPTTPGTVSREVRAEEAAAMYRDHIAPQLPGLSDKCLRSAACLYTVTPDAGFVIDAHPDWDRVLVVSACSGHGFKHSAAIGEAVCERTLDGKSRLDLGAFALSRFA